MALTAGFKKFVGLVVTVAVVGGGVFYGIKYSKEKEAKPALAQTQQYSAPVQQSYSPQPVQQTAQAQSVQTQQVVQQPIATPAANKLTVSIVSFHGYAPALVANGGLTTQPGSIFAKEGLDLHLKIQDDVPTISTLFASNQAECVWRTSDFWAQEQPNLRNAGFDGRVVMAVDNTQGADAIISKNPNINSIEDLAGKNIALLQFTPSHGMLIDAINNSSLTGRKKSSIRYTFINADEGTSGVRAAYESGAVDAAVLWDPDLSLALKSGGHVVYSTKQATNLIYDVMVCDTRVINSPQGHAAIQKFVDGWMKGVDVARANPDLAVNALVKNEPMFKLLADKEGKPFIKGLFKNLVWTNLADNVRIFGLNGGDNNYERVYKEFDEIYRGLGALANPNSPVINPADSWDPDFLKADLASQPVAQQAQPTPQPVFTQQGAQQATREALTKPVQINFASGSSELTMRSKDTIDKQIVPFLQNNGAAYVLVSGNTDSTGSQQTNRILSRERAQVVVDYLVKEWEFPALRFKVVGNGSDVPLCQEPGTADGLSLSECRALNRTTRISILTNQN